MEYNVGKYGNVSLPKRYDKDMLKIGHVYVGLSCVPFIVEDINDVDDEMVEYVVKDINLRDNMDSRHYLTMKHNQEYMYKDLGDIYE